MFITTSIQYNTCGYKKIRELLHTKAVCMCLCLEIANQMYNNISPLPFKQLFLYNIISSCKKLLFIVVSKVRKMWIESSRLIIHKAWKKKNNTVNLILHPHHEPPFPMVLSKRNGYWWMFYLWYATVAKLYRYIHFLVIP